MTDGTAPSQRDHPEKLSTRMIGGAYLAFAGIAMVAWIAFLVWIVWRLIAGI